MFNLNIFEREELTPIRKLLMMHAIAGGAPLNEYEIEGNPAAFQTNVQKPLAGFTIPFLPVQSGTGDPSPSNVRPISGWTGANVTRCGKNLFNPQSTESYWVPVSGAYGPAANAKSITLKAFAGETYTMSSSNERTTTNIICIAYYDKNDNRLSRNIPASAGKHVTATAPANTVKMIACCFTYSEAGNVQLEKSSSVTDFEEYKGTNYPVTFPDGQTVYGGTLDAVNGVLTVEWARFVATSSAIRRNDGNRWYIPNSYTNSIIPQADTADAVISNVFKSATGGQYDDKCFINSSGAIRFNTSEEYESINALLTAIPEMEFVFLLATPIEIPLDPITIQTLIGDNTIWTDTNGENTIRYKKKG